ncbi:hypothetical protein OH77DRAFT_1418922 [Trametes cingulata]|nr:hypothetical protein OH77DRAFT_1418922 [Trametes cingulata]
MIGNRAEQYRYVSIEPQDSLIQYDDTWEDSTAASSNEAIKQTTAPRGDSTATLDFHGISIFVFGWGLPRRRPTPIIECTVDGAPATSGSHYQLPELESATPMQLCYVEGLSDANHTLKLTVTRATEEYPFQLDMLMFRLSSSQWKDLSRLLESDTPANTTSSAIPTSTSLSPTSAASAPSKESQGVSVAPIVGGVLGAVVGLALAAFGIWFVLRRRKHQYFKIFDRRSESSDAEKVTPFVHERSYSRSSRASSLRSLQLVEEIEPSVAAATYHPSPDVSEGTILPLQGTPGDFKLREAATPGTEDSTTGSRRNGGKRVGAGWLQALQRGRRGRMASESSSDYPSEAPPLYSPGRDGSVP